MMLSHIAKIKKYSNLHKDLQQFMWLYEFLCQRVREKDFKDFNQDFEIRCQPVAKSLSSVLRGIFTEPEKVVNSHSLENQLSSLISFFKSQSEELGKKSKELEKNPRDMSEELELRIMEFEGQGELSKKIAEINKLNKKMKKFVEIAENILTQLKKNKKDLQSIITKEKEEGLNLSELLDKISAQDIRATKSNEVNEKINTPQRMEGIKEKNNKIVSIFEKKSTYRSNIETVYQKNSAIESTYLRQWDELIENIKQEIKLQNFEKAEETVKALIKYNHNVVKEFNKNQKYILKNTYRNKFKPLLDDLLVYLQDLIEGESSISSSNANQEEMVNRTNLIADSFLINKIWYLRLSTKIIFELSSNSFEFTRKQEIEFFKNSISLIDIYLQKDFQQALAISKLIDETETIDETEIINAIHSLSLDHHKLAIQQLELFREKLFSSGPEVLSYFQEIAFNTFMPYIKNGFEENFDQPEYLESINAHYAQSKIVLITFFLTSIKLLEENYLITGLDKIKIDLLNHRVRQRALEISYEFNNVVPDKENYAENNYLLCLKCLNDIFELKTQNKFEKFEEDVDECDLLENIINSAEETFDEDNLNAVWANCISKCEERLQELERGKYYIHPKLKNLIELYLELAKKFSILANLSPDSDQFQKIEKNLLLSWENLINGFSLSFSEQIKNIFSLLEEKFFPIEKLRSLFIKMQELLPEQKRNEEPKETKSSENGESKEASQEMDTENQIPKGKQEVGNLKRPLTIFLQQTTQTPQDESFEKENPEKENPEKENPKRGKRQ